MMRRALDWLWARLFGTAAPAAPREWTRDVSVPCTWCLVGNIVDEHPYGEDAEVRSGSKQFTPGTKVYCLPPQWGDGYERVIAVGRCRESRRWITVVTRAALITNWRAKAVHKEAVLLRLKDGFDGFKRQWTSRKEVEEYAEFLRRGEAGKTLD